tara:strand:- start:231 stop:440 length:210 start_codon:yes stop_codon:yes gene_type:complete
MFSPLVLLTSPAVHLRCNVFIVQPTQVLCARTVACLVVVFRRVAPHRRNLVAELGEQRDLLEEEHNHMK